MSKRFFLSAVIVSSLLSLNARAQDRGPLAVVGGQIQDPSGYEIATSACFFALDLVEGNCPYLVPELNDKNEFRTMIGSERPFYVRYVNHWQLLKGTYAMPGDRIFLNVAYGRTSLTGSNTRLLKFLDKLQPYFENSEVELLDTANFKTMDRVAFMNYQVNRRNKALRYVIEYFVGKPQLEQEMKQLLEAEINYSYALKMMRYARSSGKEKRFSFRYDDFRNAMFEVSANDPGALASPAYVQYLYELPFTLWHTEINWGMTDKPPYNKFVAAEFTIRDSIARRHFRGDNYELALYGILLDAIKDAAKVKGTPEFDAAYTKAEKVITSLGKSFQNVIYYSRIMAKLEGLKAEPKPEPKKKR